MCVQQSKDPDKNAPDTLVALCNPRSKRKGGRIISLFPSSKCLVYIHCFVSGLMKLSHEVDQQTALLLDRTNTITTPGHKYFVVLDVVPLNITVALRGKQGVFGIYDPSTLLDLENAVVHVCSTLFFFASVNGFFVS